MSTCTCGSDARGGGPEDHARDCRIRTGFMPNSALDPVVAERAERRRAQHRRERWAGLRRRALRVGPVRMALDAVGLLSFVIMGAMLHPIAGVAIFGAACLAYSWRLDDER